LGKGFLTRKFNKIRRLKVDQAIKKVNANAIIQPQVYLSGHDNIRLIVVQKP
jgi:hypothetical protein